MRPTCSFLKNRFDYFNILMFEGRLPSVPIKVGRGKRILGCLRWKTERTITGHERIKEITLTVSGVFDRDPKDIEDILIHEMIHLHELVKQGKPGERPHGIFFRNEMKRINTLFNRNITIREHLEEEVRNTDNGRTINIFGIIYFKKGERALTRVARSRYNELRRQWNKQSDVEKVNWYYSLAPELNKLLRVQTMKYYRLSPQDISDLLTHPSTRSMDNLK